MTLSNHLTLVIICFFEVICGYCISMLEITNNVLLK